MLNRCPHCGRQLPTPLKDGIASCNRCNAVFESSLYNKLMSGAFDLKKSKSNLGFDQFVFESKLNNEEAILVYSFCEENCYSIDEFRQVLEKFKIQ